MKHYLIPILSVLAFLQACQSTHTTDASFTVYGEELVADGSISASDAIEMMQSTDTLNTKVEVEILQSCTKKGCWMDVALDDGSVMKVRFKDYGFFVPKEGLEGRKSVLQGVMIREEVDVETLQHYAEDAGKSTEEIAAITEPEVKLSFVASGVLIED